MVGPSFAAPGPTSATPRAFLWANGKMHDLNALVPPNSPLYLLIPYGINDSGQIAGFGVDNNGDIHAFLATPCDRTQVNTDWCKDDQGSAAAEAESIIERPTLPFSQAAHEVIHQVLRLGRPASQLTAPQ